MYLCANHFAECATKWFYDMNAIGQSLIMLIASIQRNMNINQMTPIAFMLRNKLVAHFAN